MIRLAVILLLGWLLWGVPGHASAATQSCSNISAQCDQGEAYKQCMSHSAAMAALVGDAFAGPGCIGPSTVNSNTSEYTCSWRVKPSGSLGGSCSGGPYTSSTYFYVSADTCEARPAETIFPPGGRPAGSLTCEDGCEYVSMPGADGSTYTTPSGGPMCHNQPECGTGYYFFGSIPPMCVPLDPEECPDGVTPAEGQCKEPDKCPDGMIEDDKGFCKKKNDECPSGKISGPDGSCVDDPDDACPSGQVKGEDGSCKPDTDDDGEPDEDDPDHKKFGGGDNCQQPPTCSGDAILCGQARIQWRIECNTRKNSNVSGGSCGGNVPVCTGEKCDALEYSQLIQQWRAACALDKLARQGGSTSSGQPDWTKVSGDGTDGVGEDPEGPTRVIALGTDRLDDTGFWGGSGTCPTLGMFAAGPFGTINLDEQDWLCDLLAMTKWILQLTGAFIALGILLGWRNG